MYLSPIEEYDNVLYKRDDLYKPFKDSNINGGKVRQALSLLKLNEKLIKEKHNSSIVTVSSISSPQGIILGTVCNSLGIKLHLFIPYMFSDEQLIAHNLMKQAVELGNVEIHKVHAYHTSVADHRAKLYAKENSSFLVKFGIGTSENQDAIINPIIDQCENLPKELDNLLIPIGSGIQFIAILKGLEKFNIKVKRVFGILSGANSTKYIRDNLKDYEYLEYEIIKSDKKYNQKMFINIPFKFDPIYEAKTLRWFRYFSKINPQKEKTLIWIIGNQRELE